MSGIGPMGQSSLERVVHQLRDNIGVQGGVVWLKAFMIPLPSSSGPETSLGYCSDVATSVSGDCVNHLSIHRCRW